MSVVLVTGGGGLIGRAVVEELISSGVDVVVFDLQSALDSLGALAQRITVVRGDITDLEQLLTVIKRYAVERIVHLAGLTFVDTGRMPGAALRVNALGTMNVLDAALIQDVTRVVYTSSTGVYGYGDSYEGRLVTEDDPPKPSTVYGSIKRTCEIIADTYRESRGLDVVTVRPGFTYGPGRLEGGAGAFNRMLLDVARGRPSTFKLTTKSEGMDSLLQPLFSPDIAAALVSAAFVDSPRHSLYNPPVDAPVTISEIFDFVWELVPDARLSLDDSTTVEASRAAPQVDGSRSRGELGVPKYTLREGMAAMIDFFRSERTDADLTQRTR
jgi:UDP-glucose 4-epimerase